VGTQPVLVKEQLSGTLRQAITAQIRSSFPSLIDTDKPEPADDWQPR
jgi:hypothetical protein